MTGIFQPHSIIQPKGICSGMGVRANSGIISKLSDDPLAGIPFALRLQTHNFEESLLGESFKVIFGNSFPSGLEISARLEKVRWDYWTYQDEKMSLSASRVYATEESDTWVLYGSYNWGEDSIWLDTTAIDGNESGPHTVTQWDFFTSRPSNFFCGDHQPAGTIPSGRLKTVGLYQDLACTIPAARWGDSVAAWRDELSDSGIVAIQSVTTKRPTLQFENGVPYLQFDGVDDFLSSSATFPDDLQFVAGASLLDRVVFLRVGKYDLANTGPLQISDTGYQSIVEYPWAEATGNRVHSAKFEKTGSLVTGTMFLDGEAKASGQVTQLASTNELTICAASSLGDIPGRANLNSVFVLPKLADAPRHACETLASNLLSKP